MRILHLVHQYMPDYVGGTELYTQMLTQRQVQQGHEVAIVAPTPTAVAKQPAIENGVQVYRIPVGSRSRTQVFLSAFGHKKVIAAFEAIRRQFAPDIVHIEHLMGLPLTLTTHIREAGIPYLVTLHDYWYVCANAQLITNTDNTICDGPAANFHNCGRCLLARGGLSALTFAAPVVAPLLRQRNGRLRDVLDQAAHVIAPTQFVKSIYQEQGLLTKQVTVVPHGIEIPQDEIAAIRERRPYAPQRPLHIGFIGSVAWQKGVHVLVTAVNQLPADQAKLTIYGGLDDFSDYVNQLQQMATHPRIQFAGRVSRHDLWAKLAEIDIVVMPTLWYEVSPLTIQEVFALGIPIIASQIGAMSEKIEADVNGILVPPGDATALHAVLADFAAHPDKLQRFHHNIRPVQTIEAHVQHIDSIYHDIIRCASLSSA